MNQCMCVEDTTIEGIKAGEIYQYMHTPEYETKPDNKTYIIIYNSEQDSLPCTYDYFQQYFSETWL